MRCMQAQIERKRSDRKPAVKWLIGIVDYFSLQIQVFLTSKNPVPDQDPWTNFI